MEKYIDRYTINIVPLSEDDGGGYLATVPSLPGCMSDGETMDEAMANVREAISSWIIVAEEIGRKIPEADIYIEDEEEYSGKFSTRVGKTIHKQLKQQAKDEGVSINQLVNCYIAMGLGNDYGYKNGITDLKDRALMMNEHRLYDYISNIEKSAQNKNKKIYPHMSIASE